MPNRYEVTYEIGAPSKEKRTVLWSLRDDGADVIGTYPGHLSLSEALQQFNTPEAAAGIALLRSVRGKLEENREDFTRMEKLILLMLIGEKLTNLGEV